MKDDFPTLLRVARARRDVRLSDVAPHVGVTDAHLSRVESGERVPSADLVIRLANYFGEPGEDWLEAAGYPRIEVKSRKRRNRDYDSLAIV